MAHSDRGSQYLAIRYIERLAEAGIEPSVGSAGDNYDNALAGTVIGLFKIKVIRLRGPRGELWLNLGDATCSGGAVGCVALGDAVGEFDAFHDHRQLVGALQAASAFRGRPDEFVDHQHRSLLRQRALGPEGAMPDRGEDALDRVRGAQWCQCSAGKS